MYKMFKISAETFGKSCVIDKDKEKRLQLRNKDIGQKFENIYNLVDKEIKGKFKANNPKKQQVKEYKRCGSELIKGE